MARKVVGLVPGVPVGVRGLHEGEEAGRQFQGQFASRSHLGAMGFNPDQYFARPFAIGQSRQDGEAVAEHIAPLVPEHFVEPQGIGGLSLGDETSAVLTVRGDPQGFRPALQTQNLQVAVHEGVDVETMAQDPLFVPPIAGGLLAHQLPVIDGLVVHPLKGLCASLFQKDRVSGEAPEHTQDK